MNLNDYFQIGFFFILLFALTPLVGNYLGKIYNNEKFWLKNLFFPVERILYKICLINSKEEMNWKKYALSVAGFSVVAFLTTFLILVYQSHFFLNPFRLADVPLSLAFNTAVSFMTNTNWQAYSGENTLSYFTQMVALGVQNFASAAVGIAILLAFIRGILRKETSVIGNFWVDMIQTLLYVLLPLSLVVAILLISQGVIQNFSFYVFASTLEGVQQIIPMGPVASQVAIKQLGTNGGGFFGVNSAHPFENPTALSNLIQMLSILLLPSALVYFFAQQTKAFRHAWLVYLVMLIIFCTTLFLQYRFEGSMEGKEVRFGVVNSVLWSTATTAASNGSVNAMLDSFSPLSGGLALFQILLGEIVFGGVGAGLYGMLLFILLTVFLAGLMVGRTPEYLGKKIEAFDVQMVLLAILLPCAMVLMGTAWAVIVPSMRSQIANQGPHGLTEILYAFASAANNNGSAFGGLNANITSYNLLLGMAMLVGRFGVIFPVLAIAGNLAKKKATPPSVGTFSIQTPTFAILLLATIFLVGALTFMPALVVGPVVEHLLLLSGRTF